MIPLNYIANGYKHTSGDAKWKGHEDASGGEGKDVQRRSDTEGRGRGWMGFLLSPVSRNTSYEYVRGCVIV